MGEPLAILVDSNIIIDILSLNATPEGQWSHSKFCHYAGKSRLLINQVVFSEVSSRFESFESADKALIDFEKVSIPFEAAYLASQIFRSCKKQADRNKTYVLPDFLIGAHAVIEKIPLLTRDRRLKRSFEGYSLDLITP